MPESGPERRSAPELLTSHADVARVYPESLGYRLKRLALGKPKVTEQLVEERLNKPVALGVLAPDCISSSAYGTEEILTQLTPFIGLAAFSLVLPIMFVILGVLFLVTTSYLDVIKYYTTAGGSYVVARDNFGTKVAQIAAVALLIDYTVTVAVQCSAGTAALTSAVPALQPDTVWITVGIVLLLVFGNLRGIREAGRWFAFPTYAYVTAVGATIVIGIVQKVSGTLHKVPLPATHLLVDGHLGTQGHGLLYGVAFLTLLRAYANGGSSLTGLEAISNGVQAFRKPESRNARITLVVMSCVLGYLLLGVTLLASWTHAIPYQAGSPTVLSQEVNAVFGGHGLGHTIYYIVVATVILILYTGGNTSFNGFPFLANYVATDQYLPRQLTKRGHRLAFSNGILALGVVSLALIIAFHASVNGLVALYAIGVFTGFTMAGLGMVKRHLTRRERRWRFGVAVNALSASVCGIVVLIFAIVKFTKGAWVVVIIGPILYVVLLWLHREYVDEDRVFERTRQRALPQIKVTRVVVFLDGYDLPAERALRYVSTLNAYSVRFVHFDIDPVITRQLTEAWGRVGTASEGLSLEIAECDDRRLDRAALELVADVVRDPDVLCMVILPRRSFSTRLSRLLHDRTADAMAEAVMHVPRTAATIMPFRRTAAPLTEVPMPVDGDDVVERGGHRGETDLAADRKLAQRSQGSTPIGTLRERDVVEVAGRVRAVTEVSDREGREMRAIIADATGSIALVFQGRTHVPGIDRGTRLLVRGTVSARHREAVILNPDYEIVAAPATDGE